MTHKLISEDDFYATYKPVKNPFEKDAPWDGSMLETYGQELAHVEAILKTAPETVWTVLDCDGAIIATSGFHVVNRLGYIISEVPVPQGDSVETIDDNASSDDEEGE